MNSKFLQAKFIPYLKRNGFDFAIENVNVFGRESDVLAYKGNESYEFEFKIGESDFRKDIKKGRHVRLKPNFFYYVVPDIAIIKGEHLEYAGIYLHKYSKDGKSIFKLIKEPQKIKYEFCNVYELYSLLRKVLNGKKIY